MNTVGEYIIDKTYTEDTDILYYEKLIGIAKKIYSYIDWDAVHIKNKDCIFDFFEIYSEDDFINFLLNNTDIDLTELNRIMAEIDFYEAKIQKEFMERCKVLFNTEKEYPNIVMKEDSTSKFINQYKEYFNYEQIMMELQSGSEFSFKTWFPENIGKAYCDYSWRELEAKKIYITIKNISEGFREAVKAKAMEVSREEVEKSSPKRR